MEKTAYYTSSISFSLISAAIAMYTCRSCLLREVKQKSKINVNRGKVCVHQFFVLVCLYIFHFPPFTIPQLLLVDSATNSLLGPLMLLSLHCNSHGSLHSVDSGKWRRRIWSRSLLCLQRERVLVVIWVFLLTACVSVMQVSNFR
jgi:hypothetical protein